jgi:hypothetical protein
MAHSKRGNMGNSKCRTIWLGTAGFAAVSFAFAMPLIAGRAPTSLLPPGFGSEPAESPAPSPSSAPSPTGTTPSRTGAAVKPGLQLDLANLSGPPAVSETLGNAQEAVSEEELAEQQQKYDLPAGSSRSLARIGPLTPETGGLAADSFGSTNGRFLTILMQKAHAPIVSRWASILLRRTLLSATNTPADVNGADWAAERAWLLVRMGEADSARMMVQSVDARNYTPRLGAVAMQAYLASADPVGLCGIYQGAENASKSPSWTMAEAICASFSAEQGKASAILNAAQRRGTVRSIDYRLTEKVVGAGTNARRSVKIEWDDVERLTAWRFGLATAVNVDVPDVLMGGVGTHVWAWQARAPMLSTAIRLKGAEQAARLGVFSSAALVDVYSQLSGSDGMPEDFQPRADDLRKAYGTADADDRLNAMRELWNKRPRRDLLPYLLVARAAATVPVSSDVSGEDAANLIAAMLTAGYDTSAERWAGARDMLADSSGADAWALLAVGAPRPVVQANANRVRDYLETGARGRLLLAGLAGLERLRREDITAITQDAQISFAPRTRWELAIEAAANRRERGTVVLLSAIGMQVSDWSRMPAQHLYHIVSALRRVGLDSEARMIAAEAVMRS